MHVALATITGLSALWLGVAVGAVALTIAIHALARARARRIVFPGQRFLAQVGDSARRRSRPRNLALLALRALLLASLALAFDEPGWATSTRRAADQDVVIVVDASASMSRIVNGRTLLDRARQRALVILEEAHADGAPIGVITARAQHEALLPTTTRNVTALRARIESIRDTYERADLSGAIEAARALPSLEGQSHRRIIVLSDMQASAFASEGLLNAPDVRWEAIGADADTANAAVVDLTVEPQVAAPGQRVTVTATVRASGGFQRDVVLTLANANDALAQRTLTFGPTGEATATFTITAPDAPMTTLVARISARDALEADNERLTALVRAQPVDAAIVSQSDQPLLRAALAPDAERQIALAPTIADIATDAFVIADTGPLDASSIDALAARLRAGARVVWFVSDAAGESSFDALTRAHRLSAAPDSPLDAQTAQFLTDAIAPAGAVERFTLGSGELTVVRGASPESLAPTGALPVLLHAFLLDAQRAAPEIEHRSVDSQFPTPSVQGEMRDESLARVIVTNIDPREGLLEALTTPDTEAPSQDIAVQYVDIADVAPLWPALLVLAFVCLCIEPLVAGRSRS